MGAGLATTGPRLLPLLASLALAGTACAGPSPADLVGGQPWRVTVYYTAVEDLHGGAAVEVMGCTDAADCAGGDEPLGRYPQGFVDAVREEGSGRITSGPNSGRYLNWSYDIGYWLDSTTRDAHGRPLEPFRTAAADGLPDDTRLRLVDCGTADSGEPVPDEVCRALRAGRWEIRDRFTPGLGGAQHIDLYIGEETEPEFTTSGAIYVSLPGARFAAED